MATQRQPSLSRMVVVVILNGSNGKREGLHTQLIEVLAIPGTSFPSGYATDEVESSEMPTQTL